jgi:cytoskeleton protein RodZ
MQPPAQANATQEQASVEPTPPVDMAPAPAEPMPPVETAPAPAAVDTAELPVSQPEIEAPAPTTEATPAEQAPAAMTPEEAPVATASAEAPPAADDVAVMTPPGTDAPAAPAVEEPVHVPQTFGASNADARIVISATDDSWIEITDTNGDRLLSRTLRAGDSYRVPNREGLVFVTGNAGGLDITVDGTHVPSIGDTGIVRKNVKLDPELLKQGRAWP